MFFWCSSGRNHILAAIIIFSGLYFMGMVQGQDFGNILMIAGPAFLTGALFLVDTMINPVNGMKRPEQTVKGYRVK